MPRVLFIGHDATRTGAPIVFLHLLEWLKANTAWDMELALIDGGSLVESYARLLPTTVLNERYSLESFPLFALQRFGLTKRALRAVVRYVAWPKTLCRRYDLVYANSIASAWAVRVAQHRCPVPALLHMHELDAVIEAYGGRATVNRLAGKINEFVAAGPAVADLLSRYGIDKGRITPVNEFIPCQRVQDAAASAEQGELSACVPSDAWVVGGCGTISERKGVDLFVEAAARIPQAIAGRPVHFVWLGSPDIGSFMNTLIARRHSAGLDGRLHFLPARPSVAATLATFDAFALTSREDPMPLVALEAAALRRPVVCFRNTGAIPALFGEHGCVAVDAFDTTAFAAAVTSLLTMPERSISYATEACRIVQAECDVNQCAPRIFSRMNALMKGTQ